MTSSSNPECADCREKGDKTVLEIETNDSATPCPKCGSLRRHINISVTEHIDIEESIGITSENEHKKTSYPLLIISFLVVAVASFSVYYITNSALSIIVGLILGFVAWYVGKDSIQNIKEKTSSWTHYKTKRD